MCKYAFCSNPYALEAFIRTKALGKELSLCCVVLVQVLCIVYQRGGV